MSELPPAFVKFSGAPTVATPIKAGSDLMAVYEVVNMGNGPTTSSDEVWASACYQGAVVHQASARLDSPPVDAGGGSHRGSVHFDGHYFSQPGEWTLEFAITDASNNNVDESSVPFTVEAADPGY
jgi:hypothetical protein